MFAENLSIKKCCILKPIKDCDSWHSWELIGFVKFENYTGSLLEVSHN